jgi:hypothetical protein
MKRELASTRTVFSTVMAALVFGFAAGLPLGYAARYFSEAPSSPNLASLQNGRNRRASY